MMPRSSVISGRIGRHGGQHHPDAAQQTEAELDPHFPVRPEPEPLEAVVELDVPEDGLRFDGTVAAEAVYRTEIRTGHPRQPHVVHVLVQQALHPATGVDVAHIGIHDHLQQHPRMEAARAISLVSGFYAGDGKSILLSR